MESRQWIYENCIKDNTTGVIAGTFVLIVGTLIGLLMVGIIK